MGKMCPNCGKELSDSANFCGKCGSKYEESKKCSMCGNPLKTNMKFCSKCGSPVDIDRTDDKNMNCGNSDARCHKFKISKVKKKKWIIISALIFLVLMVVVLGNGGEITEESYIDSKDFKERFCENIGAEYNSENWSEIPNNTTSHISQQYSNGNGLKLIIFINNDDKVVGANIVSELTLFSGIDEEFLWKCALVSAITRYDLEKSDSIVRELNKNGQTMRITDEIIGNPYQETEDGLGVFSLVTKKYNKY